jgi:hypothetical protein
MPERKPVVNAVPQPGESNSGRVSAKTERHDRIAVEAYYNAERRGFQPGGEIDDWLEAEKLVDGGPVGEAPQPVYRPVNLNVREEILGRERPSPLDAGLPDEPEEPAEKKPARGTPKNGKRLAA